MPPFPYSLALSRETTEPAVNSRYGGRRNQQPIILVDGHSAKRFLVDTGAAVSVYPASFRDINGGSHTRSLVAANGSNIATYGTRRIIGVRDGGQGGGAVAPPIRAVCRHEFGQRVDIIRAKHNTCLNNTNLGYVTGDNGNKTRI